ncbi:MAG: hypothetical protein Fur006_33990 [Coleofasciculaceae cyanobacterium]
MSRVLAGTSGYIVVAKISFSTIGTSAEYTCLLQSTDIEILALENGNLLNLGFPNQYFEGHLHF